MEWKTEFVDHSLQYFIDVWKRFSSNYILPDVSPTALLDCVHIGCLSITWLVPSDLVPQLIKSAEINTEFFYKHHILKVTVGDRCVYEEERSTSVSITFCTPGFLLLSSHWPQCVILSTCRYISMIVLEPNILTLDVVLWLLLKSNLF